MAEITAKAVNELRQKTGLGLMECKALLKEADGDMKRAESLAREKGMVKGAGRSGRATRAGRVEVALAPDGHAGAIVELNCETDFVARNDAFRQAARDLAELALATGGGDLLDRAMPSEPSKTVRDFLMDLNVRTGENVTARRAERLEAKGGGRVDAYVHHNGSAGALVEVDGPVDPALVKDLAMHVVAIRPIAVRREEVPAAAVAEQREILAKQMENDPEMGKKPAQVREKIAEGKLNAWFGEVALLDQPFAKEPSKKVRDLLTGGGTVARIVRFAVGEGAESEAAES